MIHWGYHLTNNFLHAINGLLVFFLALRVLGLVDPMAKQIAEKQDDNALIAAFLAASLFIVHPQHVESVAWVAERKDLLCQLFLLLSLLTYVKFVTSSQENKVSWYFQTLGLFLLAVLSKPMAVTFPAVLLLIDVYPLRRTGLIKSVSNSVHQQSLSHLIVEKIPFFLLSSGLVLATLIAQESAIATLTGHTVIRADNQRYSQHNFLS